MAIHWRSIPPWSDTARAAGAPLLLMVRGNHPQMAKLIWFREYGAFLKWSYSKMDGLFHGKSHENG